MRQWESDPENEEMYGCTRSLSMRIHSPLSSASFQWEWATYVIETSPAKPYAGNLSELMKVEQDMRERYVLLISVSRVETNS